MAIVYKGKAKQLPYSNQFNDLYALVRAEGYKQLEIVFRPPDPAQWQNHLSLRAVRFFPACTENDMQPTVTVNVAYDDIYEILERQLLENKAYQHNLKSLN